MRLKDTETHSRSLEAQCLAGNSSIKKRGKLYNATMSHLVPHLYEKSKETEDVENACRLMHDDVETGLSTHRELPIHL